MIDEKTVRNTGSMKGLLRPTLVITAFTVGGQAVGFFTQVVIAAAFGARADMDAFLAANTLPQYVMAVLLSALGFVFIPVFIDYTATKREEEAWRVASGVITFCGLILVFLAAGGMIFAKPLLHVTTPGLSPESLNLASYVAMITWPTIVATGLVSLLTGIYQAQQRFGWPAAVPFIGALVNLGLVMMLAHQLGVVGVAIAAMASLAMQFLLLMPIVLKDKKFHLNFNWHHPGVQQVYHLLWPLVVSGMVTRWSPIIERYLASDIGESTISHLGYAFKLMSLLIMLVSAGITTVVFPRMALNIAGSDVRGLRHTVSLALRMMWLAIAPAVVIGVALALPLVTNAFQRGQFSAADAHAVAGLLQIYLFSLVGSCLGNITGRTFYALKNTRIIAIGGTIEAVLYIIYTPLLARWLGAAGVALGYVLYFDLSLGWTFPVLRYKMGNTGGRTVLTSFIWIGVASLIGGAGAWVITAIVQNAWLQLIIGGIVGFAMYLLALLVLRSGEAHILGNVAREYFKARYSA